MAVDGNPQCPTASGDYTDPASRQHSLQDKTINKFSLGGIISEAAGTSTPLAEKAVRDAIPSAHSPGNKPKS